MIPELGLFALILALLVAVVQTVLPIWGAQCGHAPWIALAVPAARTQFGLVALAFAVLCLLMLQNDFSVAYVAHNSNSALPWIYRLSAVWGAHEGSLLLWMLMLSGWAFAVTLKSAALPAAYRARVLGVLGFVGAGFLSFMLFTSNPFKRLLPAAVEGRDLNPLLQDPGLIIHPPMLYMGYVGFSVAFAFACAALLGGRLDAAWARWSRPWTLAAWLFLTVGIALGSWWAYYELGWGGWWFWDPVENASFMPWLAGTALIHSLAVTEKRGAFKSWTVLLAIIAFSLSLLGTFLVRSGVLVSVHAFASDPARGVYILAFLGVVVGGSLALYAWRAPRMQGGGAFALLSRETLLLLNNVLLAAALFTVLVGTLMPLLLDALNLGKISVGPPYFNLMFPLITLPMVLLAGVGPLVAWKQAEPREVAGRLWAALLASAVLGAALPLAFYGQASVMVVLGISLALWMLMSSALTLARRWRARGADGWRAIPASFWGMTLAHAGLGVFIIGVTLTSAYSTEKDLALAPGGTHSIGGYTFRFNGVASGEGPNYSATVGEVDVLQQGAVTATLHPEKRTYRVQTMPMTEAAIDPGLTRDLYVALGEPLDGGAWALRLYHKPFIRWIWLGALLMAAGGLLAALDRRYRVPVAVARPVPAPTAAAGPASAAAAATITPPAAS
jgi:cytochrome c-type biogenesis protein CcmF